jgi:molecular chaperone GrpE
VTQQQPEPGAAPENAADAAGTTGDRPGVPPDQAPAGASEPERPDESPRHPPPPSEQPLPEEPLEPGEAPTGGGLSGEAPEWVMPPAEAPPAEPGAERIAELEDRWRRALADLDNLRKRCARELERERHAERLRVASAFLPVVDNLERALSHADTDEPFVEGISSIRDQAVEVLAKLGYQRHDEVGVPFDPTMHEAVGVVDAPGTEPNTVTGIVRPGYGDGEWQLRPAAVIVARPLE